MKEPSEVLRSRMRELRRTLGVSQRALAERTQALGVVLHQPAIARIEAGTRNVSLDEAVAIAAALRVLPESLYREPLDYNEYSMERLDYEGEWLESGQPSPEPLSPEHAWLRVWTRQRHANAPAAQQRSGAGAKEEPLDPRPG